MALSERGLRAVKPALPYWAKFAAGAADAYDADANPGGYVLMAVAESRGAFDAAIPRLAAATAASLESSTGAYTNMLGRTRLREAFAATMSRTALRGRAAVHPDQLCVSSGCGALLMQLSMLLLDPGDAVILPTPTYAALYNDIGTLAFGRVVDMPIDGAGYRLTEGALAEAYARGAAGGGRVRMLLLLNPSNPLGVVHSAGELRLARDFCAARGMHLVVDEIYANSVYDPVEEDEPAPGGRVAFRSVVEVCAEDAGVAAAPGAGAPPAAAARDTFLGDAVHVLWGFSKDWAASGLRVGVLYTHNAALLEALSNVNYFTTVSNHTQDALGALLEDAAWCDGYLAHCRAQLAAAFGGLRAILDRARIPYVAPQAGMFVWLDLRALLPPGDGGGGDDPFARERALTDELFAEARVLFTPGEACHATEPGWYRCCFAWVPPAAVAVGFERLAAFAARRRGAGGAA